MLEGREAIVELMLYLDPLFPASSTIRYCRNIARGIVSAAKEKRTELLLLGWQGRTRTYGFKLGSTLDPIIDRSPADVVVVKPGKSKKYNRILVPISGGPNGGFALEIASMLLEKDVGQITVFTVATSKEKIDIVDFVDRNKERLSVPLDKITTKAVYSSRISQAILEEAAQYDLIVMGITDKPLLYQVARETIPETIAKNYPNTLVMVKQVEGIKSWIKRWI